MPQVQALNMKQHRRIQIDTAAARKQTASTRMMPVMLSEFQKMAIEYPILLTKNGETGAFVTVGLFGLEDEENLFWQAGDWEAVYRPLNLRRHPFLIGKNDNKQHADDHDYLLCLDMDNPAVSGKTGEALFDKSGAPTPFLQDMQKVLADLIAGEVQTQNFIDTLLDLKLVTPISLDITLANQEHIRAEGMYSIDEDRLNALGAETLHDLLQRGYLAPIYAMIISVGQIYALVQKKNLLVSEPSPWLQNAG